MRIIREKVINQKSPVERQEVNPKNLFKKIVQSECECEWINDTDVILKSDSGIPIHKFCLKAEELGVDISYIKRDIIEVDETSSDIKLFESVDGDSSDVILNILNSLINYYKLKYLSEWESNHNVDSKPFDDKIKELKEKRSELLEMISDSSKVEITLTIKK